MTVGKVVGDGVGAREGSTVGASLGTTVGTVESDGVVGVVVVTPEGMVLGAGEELFARASYV